MCVCVCVCERERERERDSEAVMAARTANGSGQTRNMLRGVKIESQ